MSEQCSNCKYFWYDHGLNSGVCRRYPPTQTENWVTNDEIDKMENRQVRIMYKYGALVSYPVVINNWWCGEYKVMEA